MGINGAMPKLTFIYYPKLFISVSIIEEKKKKTNFPLYTPFFRIVIIQVFVRKLLSDSILDLGKCPI